MDSEEKKDAIKRSVYESEEWNFELFQSHILCGIGQEREKFENDIDLPHVPEMIFDKNILKITNKVNPNISISFKALDAIKLIKNTPVELKLPMSDEWKEARQACVSNMDVFKPFDWTFTTEYNGTYEGDWRVDRTDEQLDLEMLSKREPINFFKELPIYEDELGDNGLSELHLKIRVMPSGFFILMRFFLRVDQSIVRSFDTRLHYVSGRNYVLQDIKYSESSCWCVDYERLTIWEADNAILKTVKHDNYKLFFK